MPLLVTPRCLITAPIIAGAVTLSLLLPANAQFWGDQWGWRQPQRQQNFFGGFWDDRQWEGPPRSPRVRRQDNKDRDRQQAPDYAHAPSAPTSRKDASIKIVVIGDAMADWLAYGLEDAFSENVDFAVVRKNRSEAGLIRFDQRRDIDWPSVARDIVVAEKPKFVVMMVGNNDRQSIREKSSGTASSAAKANAPPPRLDGSPGSQPAQPSVPETTGKHPNAEVEHARQGAEATWDFHSEKWELAYIKRIDAMIAALKSAGAPVLWVGLPAQRNSKASTDSAYLNELYRSRAEKAGIIYVDVWDGFVDEDGQFAARGPDYQGQIRRLRTPDGVYFTKYGARKLAHYVEREIDRRPSSQQVDVVPPTLPSDQAAQVPRGKAGPPAAGPVVPLTGANTGSEQLLLGGPPERQPAPADPIAARGLIKEEPPSGRADDFRWPREEITTEGAGSRADEKK